MNIIVAGSRTFNDVTLLSSKLDKFFKNINFLLLNN